MLTVLLLNVLVVGAGYGLIAMAFALMCSVAPFFNMTLGSVRGIRYDESAWFIALCSHTVKHCSMRIYNTDFGKICLYTASQKRRIIYGVACCFVRPLYDF